MSRRAPAHRASGIFDILRGLSPSRTRSRFGRLLAGTVAVLVSLLLVGAAGPVYAADGSSPTGDTGTIGAAAPTTPPAGTSDPGATPAPSADPSATPTATPTATPSATPTGAPGAVAGSSTTSGPSGIATTTGTTSTTTTTSKTVSTTTTKSSPLLRTALAAATPAVDCTAADFGGFEIDGNTTVDCSLLDWDTPVGVKVVDGFNDNSGFGGGDAENTDPATWSSRFSPNDKNDIGTAWAYSHVGPGDHVFAYFALTNNSTSGGTGQFDLEYNQLDNVVNANGTSVPHRSPGDLLLRFSSTGSGALSFTDAKEYTLTSSSAWSSQTCFTVSGSSPAAGWCTMPIPAHAFASTLNADGTFAEGAIDLTILFGAGGGCSGNFGTTQIRTVTGNAFATSSLKDYVKPLGVNTPSTCSTLVIKKYDASGTKLVGGATFAVSPDPASGSSPGPVTVQDNTGQQGYTGLDTDPTPGVLKIVDVEPATYTVEETQAPPGYLLPADASQTLAVGKSSTVTFTFNDPKKWQDLTVGNSASASYTRTYKWQLDKGVGDSQSGPFSAHDTKNIADSTTDTASFGYRIRATEDGYTDSARTVTGTVTITNPNDAPVTVDLNDTLSDNTSCTFADSTVSVPGDNTPHGYTYTCSPGDLSATSSTATVSWSKADYPQSQADVGAAGSYTKHPSAAFSWAEHAVHKSVTVTDNRYDLGSGGWKITYGGAGGPVHTTTYSRDVTGSAGTCTDSTNTATLTADDDASYQKTASATATVCVGADLAVTKTAAPTLTRTYGWQVTKTADQANLTTDAQGHATAHFTIHVKADGYTDSSWAMTGKVTVSNPNDWEAVTLNSLTDHYDGAVAGHESCLITDWNSVSHTVPAGGSRTYSYSCTFDQKPSYSGTNTATASWDAAAAATPDGSASGTVPLSDANWQTGKVHDTANLFDDGGTSGATWTQVNGAPIPWSAGLDQSFGYDMPVTVAGGTCQTFVNQARVMDGAVLLAGPASASVTVCNPQDLVVSKTANATFVRTYHWQIAKAVKDPTTVHVDSYSHTFDYTVTATPDGYTDGSWQLTGTIHVSNPNTSDGIAPVTATVTDVPTGVDGGVSCTVNGGNDQVTLASGKSADLPYTCTFTGTPSNGSNVATATWDGGSSSGSAPVQFTQAGSIDQSIEVWDDEVTGPAQLLGTATWGASATTFDYSKELTAPTPACTDFTNHAWLTAIGGTAHLDDASAVATICPNAGTWKVLKTSSPVDGSTVVPGETVTYHVTVTKTGGVDPTGVVVKDDLTAVVAHTSDPVIDAPNGTTASYDAASHTLTWNVGSVSGAVTLDYTVTVDSGAFGDTLVNHVTSRGSDNCPPDPQQESPDCTTTHYTPEWTLAKSSDPASGSQVLPGQKVTYTLTVHNTGPATLTGAQVTDNLSDVLDDATWNGDIATASGSASRSGNTLTWDVGSVDPGQSVTLTYSVTVDAGAVGATLKNVATPTTPGGDCATVGGCSTTEYTPAWTLTKSSDPASGTTVMPGDTVTYTLTLHNTGPATLTGAQVTDNLSDVLDDATLQQPLAAGLSFDGGHTMTWSVPAVAKGDSVSVSYAVKVAGNAWNEMLRNVATPGTPGGSCVTEGGCSTHNPVPHYTLTKSSSVAPGGTVMPPYLGSAGDTVTYTLTAHNDSQGVVKGATVTDDLSDVLDNASFVDGSIAGDGQGSRSGSTLTWQLPTLQPGQTAVLTYQVTVDAGQWDQTLTNVATPDAEGDCVLDNNEQPLCTTTAVTPPYTQLAVKKVDAETGAPLAGATFSLTTAGDPGTVIDTATSGADGVAVFGTKLQPGDYLVTETTAPAGYDLPQDATMPVTIGQPDAVGTNFVADGVMAPMEFRDPAQGQLAIVAKEQYGLAPDGTWQKLPDNASVHFGDEIKYVVRVSATGPKLFHDVTVTDYVPGYNPADTTSTAKGTLVPGSADCTGSLTCSVTADPTTGLVTWQAGTVTDATGTMEMVVKFPDLPAQPQFDANGKYTATLWNVGYLDWDEAVVSSTPQLSRHGVLVPRLAAEADLPMAHHRLTSNEVVSSAVYFRTSPPVKPPHHNPPGHHHKPPQAAPPPKAPTVLPNTGGPQWWYVPTGAGLVLLGAGLLIGQEARRRRRA